MNENSRRELNELEAESWRRINARLAIGEFCSKVKFRKFQSKHKFKCIRLQNFKLTSQTSEIQSMLGNSVVLSIPKRIRRGSLALKTLLGRSYHRRSSGVSLGAAVVRTRGEATYRYRGKGGSVNRIRVTNARVCCTPSPRHPLRGQRERGECSWPSFCNPFRRHSDAFDASPIRRSRAIYLRSYVSHFIVRHHVHVRRVMLSIATIS